MTNDQRHLLETQIERYGDYKLLSEASDGDLRARYVALANASWRNIQSMLHAIQGVNLDREEVRDAFNNY